jgi:hypothetical protein
VNSNTLVPDCLLNTLVIFILFSHPVNDPMMKTSSPPKCQVNLTTIKVIKVRMRVIKCYLKVSFPSSYEKANLYLRRLHSQEHLAVRTKLVHLFSFYVPNGFADPTQADQLDLFS